MSHVRPAIPMNGYRYHREYANPAWLRVLIMTQADGYYTADGSVRFHFKKQRKNERCKHLLRKAEMTATVFSEHDEFRLCAFSLSDFFIVCLSLIRSAVRPITIEVLQKQLPGLLVRFSLHADCI